MATSRVSAVINSSITLEFSFYKNGQVFDLYDISQVLIKNSAGSILQTISSFPESSARYDDITRISTGKYFVSSMPVATEQTIYDHWYVTYESGMSETIEIGSCHVYDVTAYTDDNWQGIIGKMVQNKTSSVVSPSGEDLYSHIANAALEVGIDLEITSYTTSVYPTASISPDPTVSNDNDFITLVVLRAAANIVGESMSLGASQGIKVQSGDDMIDTNIGVASKRSVLAELEKQYRRAKTQYALKKARDYLTQVIPPGSIDLY